MDADGFRPDRSASTANAPRAGHLPRLGQPHLGYNASAAMELHIPKLREGLASFPSLLEPRRRSEKALLSVIQQGSTWRESPPDGWTTIKALGCDGSPAARCSRICEQLDEVVESFLGRPLDGGPYPYVWLDGLTQKVREGGRIVNVCVVVATGVNADGQREILGMDVGASEDGAFWLAFLRSLTARGLSGVELATSDAHQGLKNAIAAVFAGASWQRCRTHFMANLLTRVPSACPTWSGHHGTHLVPATVSRRGPRPIGPSATTPGALCPGGRAAGRRRAGPLAFTTFPVAHWKLLVQQPAGTAEPSRSGRRLTWWAIFPNRQSARRLDGRGAGTNSMSEWAEARRWSPAPSRNAAANEALPEPNMLSAAACQHCKRDDAQPATLLLARAHYPWRSPPPALPPGTCAPYSVTDRCRTQCAVAQLPPANGG